MNEALPPPRVLGAVVTYEPDASWVDHLQALRQQLETVVVIDNGSSNIAAIEAAAAQAGCLLIRNQSNLGIAQAMNQGLALAQEKGVNWLWTFDQDTMIAPGAWSAMAEVLADLQPEHRFAVLGMAHRDRQTRQDYGPQPDADQRWFDIPVTISSGSLLWVPAARQLGGFDERLFIDGVDHEYCLRCRQRSWRVVKVPASQATHSLGALQAHRVLGLRLHSTNHKALRRYYMARNTAWIVRHYFRSDAKTCLRLLAVLGATVLTVALFETGRRAKLRAVAHGLADFWRGHFGPAPPELVARLSQLENASA